MQGHGWFPVFRSLLVREEVTQGARTEQQKLTRECPKLSRSLWGVHCMMQRLTAYAKSSPAALARHSTGHNGRPLF